jgi:hypothetical protein
MASHNASPSMLGYLYQVRCALSMLLLAENELSNICIEKFDDIAFITDGSTPDILIQTKHHINNLGDLTDTSVDLWRTLKVWMDLLQNQDVSNTKFLIITTSDTPENSAASFLQQNDRNPNKAYEILKGIAEKAGSKSNQKSYKLFLEIATERIQDLLKNIIIIDNSKNILNLIEDIKKSIRYSSRPEYEEKVFERIEGWWFKKSIEALCSTEPIFISQGQIRSMICDISAEYTPENLPIDVDIPEKIDIENFPNRERVFCEQLHLIAVNEKRIKLAIRDYYRAFTQRNNWIKDDLLYIDELEKYEGHLIDEWQHLFAHMQDELDLNNESEKQKAGRKIFGDIEDKDIRIRPQCSDAFVMRGSYHMLANELKVGWHFDFVQRLEYLLK